MIASFGSWFTTIVMLVAFGIIFGVSAFQAHRALGAAVDTVKRADRVLKQMEQDGATFKDGTHG
jgi:hypothetical protein